MIIDRQYRVLGYLVTDQGKCYSLMKQNQRIAFTLYYEV